MLPVPGKNRKAAYLQVTRQCNNHCIFCSNPQFERSLSFPEIKHEIDALAKQGVTEIYLTGGEPTIFSGLLTAIAYLRRQGIVPRMVSNGLRFADPKFTAKVYQAGLRNLNFSIQSHRPRVLERLNQNQGSYPLVFWGLRNVLAQGFQVQINCTLNSLNYRYLPEYVQYFLKKYPEINHFVFNNLDPGFADGNLSSRVAENPWVLVKLPALKPYLAKTLRLLKAGKKTFRVERVPLCYMRGFEEFSTETRKILKGELYVCSFVEQKLKNTLRIVKPQQSRIKLPLCRSCQAGPLCAGVQKEYLKIYPQLKVVPYKLDVKSVSAKVKKNEESNS